MKSCLALFVVLTALPLADAASALTARRALRDARSADVRGAFVFEAGGRLAAANENGRGMRCLVRKARNAAWSPDGSAIAFDDEKSDGSSALRTLSVTDGLVQTIQVDVGAPTASWSPDSRRLVYASVHEPDGGFDIVITNADGSGREVLAQPIEGREPDNPAWSPRRGEIAFTDLEPAQPTPQDPTRTKMESIFVIRPDGGGRHRIVKDIDGVFAPAWSPNGQMIAFVRQYGDIANLVGRIWVARADGRNPRPVGPLLNVFDMSDPAWSSGSRFLAVEGEPVTKRGAALGQKPHVYRLRPDRYAPTLLAEAHQNDVELNWVAWAPGAAVVTTGSGNSIALVGPRRGRPRTLVARGARVAWDPLRRDTTAYNGAADPALRCP